MDDDGQLKIHISFCYDFEDLCIRSEYFMT
jgi:hypothetical protein